MTAGVFGVLIPHKGSQNQLIKQDNSEALKHMVNT